MQVHLPSQQPIIFDAENTANDIIDQIQNSTSTLIEYFNTCSHSEQARQYLYQEFPQYYVWNAKHKKWKPRQRGFAIGRMFYIPPKAGEAFYLRTLLTIVHGPTSFEDLQSFNGIRYDTFKAACVARGLLENDGEWKLCLEEASLIQTGAQLRQLFVTILKDCHPATPRVLWDQFKAQICDDLKHKLQRIFNLNHPSENQIFDYGLYLIENILQATNNTLQQFDLPSVQNNWNRVGGNRLIREQLDYDQIEEHRQAIDAIQKLNQEQKYVYDQVIDSVQHNKGKTFFLNGPAGTGKTFCYNTICHMLRSQGKIVLCVASSGIAALLLSGGRTAHSMFKIPIELHENKLCGFTPNTILGGLIQKTDLIIWDEAPMLHKLTQPVQVICNRYGCMLLSPRDASAIASIATI